MESEGLSVGPSVTIPGPGPSTLLSFWLGCTAHTDPGKSWSVPNSVRIPCLSSNILLHQDLYCLHYSTYSTTYLPAPTDEARSLLQSHFQASSIAQESETWQQDKFNISSRLAKSTLVNNRNNRAGYLGVSKEICDNFVCIPPWRAHYPIQRSDQGVSFVGHKKCP